MICFFQEEVNKKLSTGLGVAALIYNQICWPAKYRTEKTANIMAKTCFSLVSPANSVKANHANCAHQGAKTAEYLWRGNSWWCL